MALADSVPGVSGGTVAFILGFYDEFINSISLLLKASAAFKIASTCSIGIFNADAIVFFTKIFITLSLFNFCKDI